MKHTRKVPIVVLTAAALTLTACAQSDRDSGNTASSGASGASDTKDTFTFGAAGAPEVFDPFYATDGETFRVTRQMIEGLLGIKPGTADVEPELRRELGALGRRPVLDLQAQQGVKFSDGTDVQRRGGLLQLRPDVRPERARARPRPSTGATSWARFSDKRRELALQVLRGQGRLDRRHQHHPVDLEVPDHPVARLLLDAVAHRAEGR